MKNKIINFFYKNRIIDSHIGICGLNTWFYFFATYIDTHVISLHICFYKWSLLHFSIDLNCHIHPHSLRFIFKIGKWGIDTEKEWSKQSSIRCDEYFAKKKEALSKFKNKLTEKELKIIENYDYLR